MKTEKTTQIDDLELKTFVHELIDGYDNEGHLVIRIDGERGDKQLIMKEHELREFASELIKLANKVKKSNK